MLKQLDDCPVGRLCLAGETVVQDQGRGDLAYHPLAAAIGAVNRMVMGRRLGGLAGKKQGLTDRPGKRLALTMAARAGNRVTTLGIRVSHPIGYRMPGQFILKPVHPCGLFQPGQRLPKRTLRPE